MMAAAVVVWITAYVTNNLLLCLTSRGTHYLHGWKAHGERGRANNAHLGAPWCFVMFEQYTAPAPLLWGMKEINSKRGDVYKDISKQAGDFPPPTIESICQPYSWGLLEMYKLVMFTRIPEHYRNPISLTRSIPLECCGARGLET